MYVHMYVEKKPLNTCTCTLTRHLSTTQNGFPPAISTNTNVEECKARCVATDGCSEVMTWNNCYWRTGMSLAKCVASPHFVSFQLHQVNQCKTYYRDLNTAGTNNQWKSYQMNRRMCPTHAPRCLGTSTYSPATTLSSGVGSANKICKM
jgi:hypothetical protein